jgi:hypothetical protein
MTASIASASRSQRPAVGQRRPAGDWLGQDAQQNRYEDRAEAQQQHVDQAS